MTPRRPFERRETNLLLTGRPGIGKTTVVRRVADRLEESVAGFYTEEMREGRARKGFRLVPFRGEPVVLAHVDLDSEHHVSKYGVDVAMLERLVPELLTPTAEAELVVIDEIGKMECFSPAFVERVRLCLESDVPVLATVARRGGGLIADVKRRPDAAVWEVTRGNRDALPERVLEWLEQARAERGSSESGSA